MLLFIGLSLFIYKAEYGFPFFDSAPVELQIRDADLNILVFSKANGFVHQSAIQAGIQYLTELGQRENWSVIHTTSGAVFNRKQLDLFDVIVWNNVTGRVLKKEQRKAFREFIENDGGFVGIHGAGDGSHHWPWYEDTLIGARFSHHPMNPQIQSATYQKACTSRFPGCDSLPATGTRADEWYIFNDHPADKAFDILYTIEGDGINPDGSLFFLNNSKTWGMGSEHPITWYKCLPNGRTFYTSTGHNQDTFTDPWQKEILKAGILWAGGVTSACSFSSPQTFDD